MCSLDYGKSAAKEEGNAANHCLQSKSGSILWQICTFRPINFWKQSRTTFPDDFGLVLWEVDWPSSKLQKIATKSNAIAIAIAYQCKVHCGWMINGKHRFTTRLTTLFNQIPNTIKISTKCKASVRWCKS